MRIIIFSLCILSLAGCAQEKSLKLSDQSVGKPVAFPGAEGFGKYATGGRGGQTIVVTNLNDSGPGSLRSALQKHGPRIVTFAVSGTIALKSDLVINNDSVTIAGQTAPGDGICVRNYPFRISADNVIVRYIRCRLGDEQKVQSDAMSGNKIKNIMIDHCSISWATDECASFYHNENFTMQWCIISESLNHSVHEKGDHGYGGIWGGSGASFHHNLIADHNSRLPRFSGSSTTPNSPRELVDFRNNVIYNWMHNNTYGGEKGHYNVVGNYYKPGPATDTKKKDRLINPWEPWGKYYISGNVLFANEAVTADNKKGIAASPLDSLLVNEPFEAEPITSQRAEQAYELVLANAGASLHRDSVDERVIEGVRNGKASGDKGGIIDSQSEVGGWPVLKSIVAPSDQDNDGLPDEWERAHKLNPANKEDACAYSLSKMYTNVEVYINNLIRQD